VHQVDWRRLPDVQPRHQLASVTLVGGDQQLRDALIRQAGAEGVRCAAVADADPGLAKLLGEGEAGPADPLGDSDSIIVLGPRPVTPQPEAATHETAESIAGAAESCSWTLARAAQLLAARQQARPPRLWCVTTGLREAADSACLPQAPLWGLGRIIAGEHPDLWGGIVDLDPADLEAGAAALFAALRGGREADLLAPRGGATEAARIVPLSGAPASPPLRCRADATYLITGGLGILGLETARWLAGRGARRLVLVGRTAMPPRSQWDALTDAGRNRAGVIRELEALGVTVATVGLDITDAAAAAAALSPDALGLPPIRGVVHAAGVLDNRLLGELSQDSLRAVMRPKVVGALVLSDLFPPGSLDFLAFFSSLGQFLGLPGQASYASANAFLDTLARLRRQRGRDDTVSLSWTSWRGLGMGINEVVAQELRDRGVGDIAAADAFRAWEHASRFAAGHVCVFSATERDRDSAQLPVLRELAFSQPADEAGAGSRAEDAFAGLSADELRPVLVTEVAREVGAEMRTSLDDLDVRVPLTSLGLDSVMTVAIRRRLDRRFRLQLPATLLWNHPTITAIANYLTERLAPAAPAGADTAAGGHEPAMSPEQEAVRT
jgi:6-methylsalicylic acid synthase